MLDGERDEKLLALNVDVQMNEILVAIEEERKSNIGFAACFTMGSGDRPQRFFQRVLLGMGSQFMQQVSGINLITYCPFYCVLRSSFLGTDSFLSSADAPVIFEESVGMSHDTALLLSGLNGVAYFLSALVPIPLIERVGRRKLMIFSAAGQAGTMAILAAMTADVGNAKKGIVAAVMLFVFNFFFVSSVSLVPLSPQLVLTSSICSPAGSCRFPGSTRPRSTPSPSARRAPDSPP